MARRTVRTTFHSLRRRIARWTSGNRHLPAAAPRLIGSTGRGRIAGVDLARALAIVGMLMVHVGPGNVDDFAGRLYAASHGRASILFVFVAGVGVSLLGASRANTINEARLQLAWRAMLLLPGGLVLQELDHGILVILQQYSILFVIGIAALSLSDRALLAVTVAFGVFGPIAFLAGRIVEPATFNRASVSITDPIGEIAHGLVLSGPYPLITWAAPFLLGMWIGRRDLHASPVRVALVLVGGAVALPAAAVSSTLEALVGLSYPVGWEWVTVDTPHSQMPLWLVGATGSAALVFGLALIAADALGRLVWPLVAIGQLALTVYVVHLLALHWWRAALTSNDVGEATTIVLAMTATAAAVSVGWRSVLPRGPLEALLRLPWRPMAPRRHTGTAQE